MAFKPIARVGDTHDCPIPGHGTTTILDGDSYFVIDDRPVATVGSKTGCGATITQGSPEGSVNGKDISYIGCSSSHGGVITSGSPEHTIGSANEGGGLEVLESLNNESTLDWSGMSSATGATNSSFHLRGASTEATPHINFEEDRKKSILENTPAIFDINKNPNADSSEPLIEIDLFDEVDGNESIYDDVAKRVGIDANLLKAVAYMESTHGHYDRLSKNNKSFRPMNIYYEVWEKLCNEFGYNVHDIKYNKNKNIHIGAILLKRIRDRIKNPTVEKIASIYNVLGRENTNDYGARVQVIYDKKLWEDD